MPHFINNTPLELFHNFKFLDTILHDKNFSGQKIQNLLSKKHFHIKKFHVRRDILVHFYQSIIEIIVTFSCSIVPLSKIN